MSVTLFRRKDESYVIVISQCGVPCSFTDALSFPYYGTLATGSIVHSDDFQAFTFVVIIENLVEISLEEVGPTRHYVYILFRIIYIF